MLMDHDCNIHLKQLFRRSKTFYYTQIHTENQIILLELKFIINLKLWFHFARNDYQPLQLLNGKTVKGPPYRRYAIFRTSQHDSNDTRKWVQLTYHDDEVISTHFVRVVPKPTNCPPPLQPKTIGHLTGRCAGCLDMPPVRRQTFGRLTDLPLAQNSHL